jgi:hypothetical protein
LDLTFVVVLRVLDLKDLLFHKFNDGLFVSEGSRLLLEFILHILKLLSLAIQLLFKFLDSVLYVICPLSLPLGFLISLSDFVLVLRIILILFLSLYQKLLFLGFHLRL